MTSGNSFSLAIARVESLCLCMTCPNYFDRNEPLAFCLSGTANTHMVVKGSCICPDCPLHEESGFMLNYYCITGSEIHQSKE